MNIWYNCFQWKREVGCQLGTGTAYSMAVETTVYLLNQEIQNVAEIGIGLHLGLTCYLIYISVQILCVERNAVTAMSAIEVANLSK